MNKSKKLRLNVAADLTENRRSVLLALVHSVFALIYWRVSKNRLWNPSPKQHLLLQSRNANRSFISNVEMWTVIKCRFSARSCSTSWATRQKLILETSTRSNRCSRWTLVDVCFLTSWNKHSKPYVSMTCDTWHVSKNKSSPPEMHY